MKTTTSSLQVALMLINKADAICKAVPGSPFWPSLSDWAALNSSLGRQLMKRVPPGAAKLMLSNASSVNEEKEKENNILSSNLLLLSYGPTTCTYSPAQIDDK
jgi:hypothetical protein